jgi:hypothetical protein
LMRYRRQIERFQTRLILHHQTIGSSELSA